MKKYQLLGAALVFFAFAPSAQAVFCASQAQCSANEVCNLDGTKTFNLSFATNSCIPAAAAGQPTGTTPKATSPVKSAPPAATSPVVSTPPKATSPVVTNPGETLINPLGSKITNLPSLIAAIMDFVVYIGSIIVIFMLVYIGFLFVTARGDPKKLTDARQALLYTVIGALILLGAKVIAEAIEATVTALGS